MSKLLAIHLLCNLLIWRETLIWRSNGREWQLTMSQTNPNTNTILEFIRLFFCLNCKWMLIFQNTVFCWRREEEPDFQKQSTPKNSYWKYAPERKGDWKCFSWHDQLLASRRGADWWYLCDGDWYLGRKTTRLEKRKILSLNSICFYFVAGTTSTCRWQRTSVYWVNFSNVLTVSEYLSIRLMKLFYLWPNVQSKKCQRVQNNSKR